MILPLWQNKTPEDGKKDRSARMRRFSGLLQQLVLWNLIQRGDSELEDKEVLLMRVQFSGPHCELMACFSRTSQGRNGPHCLNLQYESVD